MSISTLQKKQQRPRTVHSRDIYRVPTLHLGAGSTCPCPHRASLPAGDVSQRTTGHCPVMIKSHQGRWGRCENVHITQGADAVWIQNDFPEEGELKPRPEGLPRRGAYEHSQNRGAPTVERSMKTRRGEQRVRVGTSTREAAR